MNSLLELLRDETGDRHVNTITNFSSDTVWCLEHKAVDNIALMEGSLVDGQTSVQTLFDTSVLCEEDEWDTWSLDSGCIL